MMYSSLPIHGSLWLVVVFRVLPNGFLSSKLYAWINLEEYRDLLTAPNSYSNEAMKNKYANIRRDMNFQALRFVDESLLQHS